MTSPIAIGLVIDDAVVVTENIARHLALAPGGGAGSRLAAIRAAVQELIWPVTTSTITTVVVFLPLGLLQGVVGQFFAALATTLTVAVLVSLVLALTVIPLLAEQFVTAHEVEAVATGPLARIQRTLDALAPRYERALAAVLDRPRRIGLAALVLVAAGLALWRFVGTGFLPEMDEGAFVLDYFTPGGTALAETNREIGVAESILARTPEVTGTSRRTGAELGMFATAQNSGDIIARLTPRGRRSRDVFAVIDQVRDEVTSAAPRLHIEFMQILADVINDLAGAARPVEVKLYGERLDTLEAYARRLAPELERIRGLEDLYNGVSEPTTELLMRVNEAEANRIGMTPMDVGSAISAALLGVQAGEIRTEDRPVAVRVRAPDSVRFDPLRLRALPVLGGGARRVTPLGSLATFEPADSRLSLEREDQQQMIAMTADVSGRSLGGVMGDVRRGLGARPGAPGCARGAGRSVREPAGGVPGAAARARPGRSERVRGDGRAVRVVHRAAGGAARRAGVVRGRAGAAPPDGHGAERVVLHGADSAGGPDREERHHPARLHAPPDARGEINARGGDPRSRARAAPAHLDDDVVHAVRPLPARPRPGRRKRAATSARARRDRRADAVHARHAVRRAHAARGDSRADLHPARGRGSHGSGPPRADGPRRGPGRGRGGPRGRA